MLLQQLNCLYEELGNYIWLTSLFISLKDEVQVSKASANSWGMQRKNASWQKSLDTHQGGRPSKECKQVKTHQD